jgi:hypothetical protein
MDLRRKDSIPHLVDRFNILSPTMSRLFLDKGVEKGKISEKRDRCSLLSDQSIFPHPAPPSGAQEIDCLHRELSIHSLRIPLLVTN